MVSQKHELAVWRPAPLLCITAQVTARYSQKIKVLIIKAEEVNHSVLPNSSLRYIFKWLVGGVQLCQNLFWQPPHSQYFPQELGTDVTIIFTRVKTMALTKCLIIGLWLLSFNYLDTACVTCTSEWDCRCCPHRYSRSCTWWVLFPKSTDWLLSETMLQEQAAFLDWPAMVIKAVTIWIQDFQNRTECKRVLLQQHSTKGLRGVKFY